MAYPVRDRSTSAAPGPLRYWMLAHSYLGVIAGAVLLLHGGVGSGGALTTALMISFDLVILTGLFGILCYYVAPRMLTRIEGQPLLIEDLTGAARGVERGTRLAPSPRPRPEREKLIEKRVAQTMLLAGRSCSANTSRRESLER